MRHGGQNVVFLIDTVLLISKYLETRRLTRLPQREICKWSWLY